MNYTFSELLWLFLIYSILGWVMETVTAAIKQKQFVNKGLIDGPFCIIYGVTTCAVSVFFHELSGIWLFVASAIMATVMEWTAGHMIEKFFHERWWEYSHHKWNLDGYISPMMSAMWGILCMIAATWGNGLLLKVFHLVPALVGDITVGILAGVLELDAIATLIILQGRSKNLEKWETLDAWLDSFSSKLGRNIYGHVNKRITKAYPKATPKQAEKVKKDVFAYGCSFHKIWWLFIIGAFLGDIVETLYCRAVGGVWMSRSSVVWGTFSIVWGGALAAATLLLHRYRNRSDGFIFAVGTFLGGAYEYICSVLSEIVFGKVFWDYSHMQFNLGGRINLLYCFFWGLAAVVWIKLLYPKMSDRIEKVPVKTGKIITWVTLVFMCCNMAVSGLALIRSDQRNKGVEATNSWQVVMDERFDDERLNRIYPNAINVE